MMEATRAANGTFTNVRRSYTLGAVVVASREMTSNSTGTVSWLLGNHQGSVTVTVTNTVPATRWYSPYGDQRGPTPTVSPTSTGFLGQHEDNNELVYLNNRYHDPTLGNFISVDPLVTTTGQPYTYGNANPINYSDPTGLDPDTSSTIQFQSFGYCVGGDGRCSDASIRRLFTRFHRTNQGRAISATIDVAYQSDWGKLDGNWSSQDIDYAAAGGPALFLHDGNAQAAAIVARVAGALQGHEDVWERLDVDRSWWDRNRGVVISGVILALDVVAVAGAGTCAFTGGGGCGVSALSSVGATALSAYAAHDSCGASPGSAVCGYSSAATGIDAGGIAAGQGLDRAVQSLGGTARQGGRASAGVTVLMAPITLGNDGFFLYDAVTTNPFWYQPPSASDVLGVR